ncbi:hypothetical protein CEUSTIGMA_g9718.t1 [Chlamydomonas eustigma]|uniref:Embryonic stem cell-specific 5-hydroxymethylcytosine-binding protein n=1 Tax=Chlamydomonas eustigma TaxID=1157962 RepID=A0A250XH96_9CHLO|nr:hypothetical protein CEUSTIGMA_g9718.t1 [Chlamydomonas eustigma]|eukprot:GAX82289.1 hypothetical protein CEUSTIGMA_g9718.t1 [Chlamydomonas eustigma]
MCGRVRCSLTRQQLSNTSKVPADHWSQDLNCFQPSNNITPGRWLPVMRMAYDPNASFGEEPLLCAMKWGLIPSWTQTNEKHDHWKMFNARVESLNERPAFKNLVSEGKRCIVLINGFYEWKKEGSKKQPYYVCASDDSAVDNEEDCVMYVCGLYDTCRGLFGGDSMYTCTIITVDGTSGPLSWLHDRIPLATTSLAQAMAWLKSGGARLERTPQQHAILKESSEEEVIVVKESHPDVALPGHKSTKATVVNADYEANASSASTSRLPGSSSGHYDKKIGSLSLHLDPKGGMKSHNPIMKYKFHPVTAAMTDPSYNAEDCHLDVRKRKGAITSFFMKSATGIKKTKF